MTCHRVPTVRLAPFLFLALVVCAAQPAASQVQIEKSRPAPEAGKLSVRNDFGSVVVRAWDRSEVVVRGTLAAGAEELSFDSDSEGTWISVRVPDSWFHTSDDDTPYRSVLEIQAPMGSHVEVESVNADVTIEGFRGEIEVETVNGDIGVRGPAREVEVETMTGRVEVAAAGAPMEVDSISGPVVLSGARDEVSVETVSATVEIRGSDLHSVDVETTTGSVVLAGSLTTDGNVEIRTFSGQVTLVLPKDVRARFELETFSGEIRSSLGAGTPDAGERFVPFRRRRFSTGLDGMEVQVRTHDADIVLETAE